MKKVKFIALLLVLSLAVVGAGYAAWTDQTTINGTVETGYLDTVFTSAVSNDAGTAADPGQTVNVGKTEATYSDKEVVVAITNAYPGYNSKVDFTIKNQGTMPIKVTGIAVVNANGDKVDVTVSGISVGDQINPGATVSGKLTNVVTGAAEESANYSYTATVSVRQWNL